MARQHARRSYHLCGAPAAQSEMTHQNIFVETGQSKAFLSGATITSAALGGRSARNSIVRTLFNTGGQTYNRQRQVWCCDEPAFLETAVEASRKCRKTRGVRIRVRVAVGDPLIVLMFAAAPPVPLPEAAK